MNPLKLKRMKQLAEALRGINPAAAWDLISMIEAQEQPAQPKTQLLRESLPGALERVSQLLSGYRWCLAGGLAVVHWANVRVTYDVDCLVVSEDLERLKKELPGYQSGNLGMSSEIDGVTVDFLDASLFSYAQEAVETAVMERELGVSVPVMRPEYLVLFKLESMREKDNTDAFALLRVFGVAEKARAVVRKHRPQMIDDLEQAISIAEMSV